MFTGKIWLVQGIQYNFKETRKIHLPDEYGAIRRFVYKPYKQLLEKYYWIKEYDNLCRFIVYGSYYRKKIKKKGLVIGRN